MEDFRSKSYGDGRMQIEGYSRTNMQDLRCYSASYDSSVHPTQTQMPNNDPKFRKGKSTNGSTSKSWSFSDPELQRKKRVASYKVYAVEGKLKGSLRKSFKWLKDRCNRVVYGCVVIYKDLDAYVSICRRWLSKIELVLCTLSMLGLLIWLSSSYGGASYLTVCEERFSIESFDSRGLVANGLRLTASVSCHESSCSAKKIIK
ncbi:ATP-dependent DNA helicase Q 1 [Spatholobus suberectus]|nr:ATP-dependent DNA helicase Q 1 [Spatholobus suberectus]